MFKPSLPYSEVDEDYHLCPLPRQRQPSRSGSGKPGRRYLDRQVSGFLPVWIISVFLWLFHFIYIIFFIYLFFHFFFMFSGRHTWSHDVEAVSMSTLGLHGNSSHPFECLDSTVVRGRWSNKLVLHIGGINLVSATKPCSTL